MTPKTKDRKFLVLDVETRQLAADVGGWGHKDRMQISVAVTYNPDTDTYHAYGEDEIGDLMLALDDANLVIGFNLINFDYYVLYGALNRQQSLPIGIAYYRNIEPVKWPLNLPTVDIMQRLQLVLGHRVSLDSLAAGTLDEGKTGSGLQAVSLWQRGMVEELTAYCKQDVLLTWRIYAFGIEHGNVCFIGRDRRPHFAPATWAKGR